MSPFLGFWYPYKNIFALTDELGLKPFTKWTESNQYSPFGLEVSICKRFPMCIQYLCRKQIIKSPQVEGPIFQNIFRMQSLPKYSLTCPHVFPNSRLLLWQTALLSSSLERSLTSFQVLSISTPFYETTPLMLCFNNKILKKLLCGDIMDGVLSRVLSVHAEWNNFVSKFVYGWGLDQNQPRILVTGVKGSIKEFAISMTVNHGKIYLFGASILFS